MQISREEKREIDALFGDMLMNRNFRDLVFAKKKKPSQSAVRKHVTSPRVYERIFEWLKKFRDQWPSGEKLRLFGEWIDEEFNL